MINHKFYINNRKRLAGDLKDGPIVVTANGLVQRRGDVTFPFGQDGNFLYLTGLSDLADAVLVIDGEEEFLILPKRSEVENIFGGEINRDNVANISGIKNILSNKEGWDKLYKTRLSRKKIYTVGAAPSKINALDSFYTNPARRTLIAKLKRTFTSAEIIDIRLELIQMRQIKQTDEIDAIKKAIEITKLGFQKATDKISEGVFEYEIEAEFDYVFKQNNTVHGYGPPIVAAGKNACALHYRGSSDKLFTNEFVLVDVGAEYSGYSADITRMRAVGNVSRRHHEIYKAVDLVHKSVISILKDGITWRDYVVQVDEIMAQQLIKLGLIKENKRSEVRKYFPHGISHSLGIDVHDVCDYKTIKENMVITVEPGIYIPEEGIGVRIEDDVLITKNGAVNLSEGTPYK